MVRYIRDTTLIRIKKRTRIKLEKRRLHQRETYDDIINRLLKGTIIG